MNLVDPVPLSALRKTTIDLFAEYQHQLVESELAQAMAYTLKPKSKLIRPLLIACIAHSTLHQALTQKAMLAIELIHTYSLIHDDLPAMDNDNMRRGQASCHLAFDESTAILAGDALLTEAFEILSDPSINQPAQQIELCHILAKASGRQGMALGQWQDLHPKTSPNATSITKMYALKTGKLIEAAFAMGMVCANIPTSKEQSILTTIGQTLGVAFQIKDDLLDLLPEHTTGKPQFSDQDQNKQTYLALYDKKSLEDQLDGMRKSILNPLNMLSPRPCQLIQLIDEILAQP